MYMSANSSTLIHMSCFGGAVDVVGDVVGDVVDTTVVGTEGVGAGDCG